MNNHETTVKSAPTEVLLVSKLISALKANRRQTLHSWWMGSGSLNNQKNDLKRTSTLQAKKFLDIL